MSSMEIKKISYNNSFLSASLNAGCEGEITLPDYLPDIKRVVRVDAKPIMTAVTPSEGKVNLQGRIECVMLYLTEDSPSLQSHIFRIPFAETYGDKQITDKSRISSMVVMDSISCKPMSSRKLSVSAEVSIALIGDETKEASIINAEIPHENVEILTSLENIAVFTSRALKDFSIEEMIELPSGTARIERLLKCDADIHLVENKIINNKVVLKGNVALKTLYLSDTQNGSIEEYKTDIPFNQIVDAEGVSEDSIIDVNFTLTETAYGVMDDTAGDERILSCKLNVHCDVMCYDNKPTTFVLDAYAPHCHVKEKATILHAEQLVHHKFCTSKVMDEFEIPGGILGIYASEAVAGIKDVQFNEADNTVTFSGNIFVSFLIRDDENELNSLDESLPFSCDCECHIFPKNACFLGRAHLHSFSYKIGDNNQIIIEAAVDCSALLRAKIPLHALESATVESCTEEPQTCLTLYYPEKGESLWEIGKHYKVSQQSLRAANHLEGALVPMDTKMLLIEK